MKLPHSPWEAEEGVPTPARGQGHPPSHCLPAPPLGWAPPDPTPWHRVGAGKGESRPRSWEDGRLARSMGWHRTWHGGHRLWWGTGWRGHGLVWAMGWHGSWDSLEPAVAMGHGLAKGNRLAWGMGCYGSWDGMGYGLVWVTARCGSWVGRGRGRARGMGQHGSGVGTGHELERRRAQPWLAGGSSVGSSASYSPMKLSRTCTPRTERVAGHRDTLECHPIPAWLQMLPHYRGPGGWLFQGRT